MWGGGGGVFTERRLAQGRWQNVDRGHRRGNVTSSVRVVVNRHMISLSFDNKIDYILVWPTETH